MEHLRVTGLLDLEHRGSIITTRAVALARQFVLARKPGSSRGPRRSETAQAVASVEQFVSARAPESNKGPRHS